MRSFPLSLACRLLTKINYLLNFLLFNFYAVLLHLYNQVPGPPVRSPARVNHFDVIHGVRVCLCIVVVVVIIARSPSLSSLFICHPQQQVEPFHARTHFIIRQFFRFHFHSMHLRQHNPTQRILLTNSQTLVIFISSLSLSPSHSAQSTAMM